MIAFRTTPFCLLAAVLVACGGSDPGQAPGVTDPDVPTTTDGVAGSNSSPTMAPPTVTANPSPAPGSAGAGSGDPTPGDMGLGGMPPATNLPGTAGSGAVLPSSVFFSDDFEDGRDPAWQDSNIGGGSISLDTSLGASGSSASIRIDGVNGFHTMLELSAPAFAPVGNAFFGRTEIRVDQPVAQGHFVWIEAGTLANDEREIRIGSNLSWLQINHIPGDQDLRAPGVQLMPQTWHCLEFQFDGNADALAIWLDGVEVTALNTTTFVAPDSANGNQNQLTDWMPPFEAIRFGWELQGQTIWYDDIVLASDRIGCQ